MGQLYTPEDADQLMFYKEDKNGQILQEGINEAGAMSSWIASDFLFKSWNLNDSILYILLNVWISKVGDLA